MIKFKIYFLNFAILIALGSCRNSTVEISLKSECLKTLYVLADALLDLQVTDTLDQNFGALSCDHCSVYHTRAGEAVFPFAVAYKHSSNEKYIVAAKRLGRWLIEQQLQGGEWRETPEEWTGTTTDQLLMMALAFPIIKDNLTDKEKELWEFSIRKAADYLVRVMSPEFASINYCATTTASLAMTSKVFPDKRYLKKAQDLAIQVVSRMDEDGFISGEGGRIYGIKYGVDVGYEIDMSLWGLGLYAKSTGDEFVDDKVKESLKNHLYFVYPNGSIDGSWGIRSNKWTTYGSKTADGCQILFSLYASEDSRYRAAAIRNLEYLREMIKDGLIGYGPCYWDIFDESCIYPTFARAKNLAMAIELGEQDPGETPPLPTDQEGWVKYFPTVDVALVRSKNLMTTITAYGYKDVKRGEKSKYMYRPTGGSISNLWVEGHGFLQTSSQTEYHRWEPMHFPEVGKIYCLTPRIEFENENGYFTNLYEFDGRISVDTDDQAAASISTSGELRDKNQFPGGIAYTLTHTILDDAIEKTVKLKYLGAKQTVRIVEPIVWQANMNFILGDSHTVFIRGGKRDFRFEVLKGDVEVELGKDEYRYWSPFPSLKCYPIVINVAPGENFTQEIKYRISIVR